MSSFCTNCGTQLPDSAAFCPQCGTARRVVKVEATPQSAPVPAAPQSVTPAPAAPVMPQSTPAPQAPVAPQSAAPAAQKTPLDWKKLLIPAIAVVAILAIVLLVLPGGKGSGGSSYEDAIDNYFSVHILGNISQSKVKALAPAEYWEYMEEEEGEDFYSYYAEIEDELEDYMDELEDQFGKNVKVTYEITKEKEISNKKLGYIAAYLEKKYDIDEDDVTAAYELDLEYTVKGSEDDYNDEAKGVYVVKIGGKWYVVSADLDGEDTTVYFLV